MNRRASIRVVVAALLLTAGAGLGRASQEEGEAPRPASMRTGVVLAQSAKQLTLWTKNGREVFQLGPDTVLPQRKVKDGNLVVVRETAAGSRQAARVLIVDEQVFVTGKSSREHAVIGTTWQAQSPSQLVVRTKDGRQAFVVDPKRFRQPLPKPNQRVAVTYRIETVKPPRYIATGLIVLPEALEESPVRITYSPIPEPEAQVAEAPQPAPAPRPAPLPEPEFVLAELPQTASRTPLLVVGGLLLVGLGLALRNLRRA